MPLITAFPDTNRAYMRVEVNWADTPAVQYAKVLRVNEVTGECTPLRPYVCFDGDYLKLSCGHGIFWDTELPLDTPVHYVTEGVDAPCIPPNPFIFDTYTRTLVDSWGSPNIGPAYTLSGGTNPGNYDVNGIQGTQTNDSVNVLRFSILDAGRTDVDVTATIINPVLPLTAGIIARVIGRMTDVNNHYAARVTWQTTGRVNLEIIKVVAGVSTTIAGPFALDNHAPGDRWRVRLVIAAASLKAKAWNITTGQAEPVDWQLSAVDTTFVTGNLIALATRKEVGNTNGTVILAWDNLVVNLPCVPCVPVTATTAALTMPSNGIFAFGDPVRPCNDLRVPLCFSQPTGDPSCVPGNGVFFASMGDEQIDSNSIDLLPTNADLPITMSRQNRGISSVLTLVTRTFADRDALKALLKPGGPVLFRGVHAPSDYGIDNQYMSVANLTTARGLTDHRYPVRINDMPYLQTRRPAGPSQGVCGSQVDDMCDIYSTWQAIDDAGLNWDDLIRGRASHDGGDPIGDYRTWTIGPNTVLADFANWNAVNTAGRTWKTLEEGA